MSQIEVMKPQRRYAKHSGGTIILSLRLGEEKVALVFNIRSQETKRIPKRFLARNPRLQGRLVEIVGDYAYVWFDQADGLGSPFGKDEDEDGGDRVKTALRETLEETGVDVSPWIYPEVSYTEQPSSYDTYSNTVYAVNGTKFAFNRRPGAMRDPLVDPRFSGLYSIRHLPFKKKRPWNGKINPKDFLYKAGIYQAAWRRIVAILLQLKREHLTALGRPGTDSADDLVRAALWKLPYYNFFSFRGVKTFATLNRPDILFWKLKKDPAKVSQPDLARQMARNLIIWLDGRDLDQALELLLERLDPVLLSGYEDVADYIGDQLLRKKSIVGKAALKLAAEESEEGRDTEVVEDEELPEELEDSDLIPQEPSEVERVGLGQFHGFEKDWISAEAAEARERETYLRSIKKGGSR